MPSEKEARSNVVEAIKEVATQLNNTPAVCRKAYVHPDVIQAYLDGDLVRAWRKAERSLGEWTKGSLELGGHAAQILHEQLHLHVPRLVVGRAGPTMDGPWQSPVEREAASAERRKDQIATKGLGVSPSALSPDGASFRFPEFGPSRTG